MPESLIGKFSQRTAEIEAEAKRRGITDQAEKAKLGARTREAKVKVSRDELLAEWKARLTDAERAALEQVRAGAATGPRQALKRRRWLFPRHMPKARRQRPSSGKLSKIAANSNGPSTP